MTREVSSVGGSATLHYQVIFTRDPGTASVVAEIPALQIADFGADVPEALERLQAMATFHLDCLVQEGKPIPTEEREDAGFYLRVKLPPHAA
jgi:predicted RNase H-like HicB family nuclease